MPALRRNAGCSATRLLARPLRMRRRWAAFISAAALGEEVLLLWPQPPHPAARVCSLPGLHLAPPSPTHTLRWGQPASRRCARSTPPTACTTVCGARRPKTSWCLPAATAASRLGAAGEGSRPASVSCVGEAGIVWGGEEWVGEVWGGERGEGERSRVHLSYVAGGCVMVSHLSRQLGLAPWPPGLGPGGTTCRQSASQL